MPIGLILGVILLGMAVVAGTRLFDARPLLVLSQEGLYYRDWKAGIVRWEDVSEVRADTIEPSRHSPRRAGRYLWLELSRPKLYLDRVHGSGDYSDEYAADYFHIPLANVRADPEELLEQVRSRAGAARSRERTSY